MWRAVVGIVVLVACGSSDGDVSGRLTGTVRGLAGTGLVLGNGGEQLAIHTDGPFEFSSRLRPGDAYEVTVASHPTSPDQFCSVENGSGMAGAGALPAITVTCVEARRVSGTVTGLIGVGLTLRISATEEIPVAANGAFELTRPRPLGEQLDVTVSTQPSSPPQACFVSGGNGTVSDGGPPLQVICSVPLGTLSLGFWRAGLVKADGTLWGWGLNSYSLLGDGSSIDRTLPTQIGTSMSWRSVDASWYHSCALRTDGTIWCWGSNGHGQLGDGTTEHRVTPVQVGTSSDWVSVDVGSGHTCALRTDGTLWYWGYNGAGELGTGLTTMQETAPVQVGTDTDWAYVSAGGQFTCATKLDGRLWCWGINNGGTIGDGTTLQRTTPILIGTASWAMVSAGDDSACGVQVDGSLWCWGFNTVGQLGIGTTDESVTSPAQVAPGTTWSAVSTSATNAGTCAMRTDGTSWCWGANDWGSVGDGTNLRRNAPSQIITLTPFVSIISGGGFACAQSATASIYCWGANGDGLLGTGTKGSTNTPSLVNGTQSWSHVSAAGKTTCAIASNGTLWCWGQGALGTGDRRLREEPSQVGTATDWTAISTGGTHTCGLRSPGTLWCWGLNLMGQLGNGTSDGIYVTEPAQVGALETWVGIEAHVGTCAVKNDGTLWCWGAGITSPQQFGVETSWRSLDVYGRLCGLRTDNSLWCSTGDFFASLGGTSPPTVAQVGASSDWSAVAVGSAHVCAIDLDGYLWCWGSNQYGQLGTTAISSASAPTQIGTVATWARVAAGGNTTCATRSDNTLWCWGANDQGALGDGTYLDRSTPTQIGSAGAGTDVAVGATHSCAISSSGSMSCSGLNGYGQLGDGKSWEEVPALVIP